MGELFFTAVNTKGHPLEGANFLEKASSVILAYVLANAGSADATSTTLAVNYYILDTMFFMGAAISHTTLDNGPVDDSETDWGVAVGVTTIEGLLVTTDYFNDAGYDLNL